MNDNPNLDDLSTIAATDQHLAAVRQVARTVAAYHHTLREQGCGREAALWLTRDWQAQYMARIWPFGETGAG